MKKSKNIMDRKNKNIIERAWSNIYSLAMTSDYHQDSDDKDIEIIENIVSSYLEDMGETAGCIKYGLSTDVLGRFKLLPSETALKRMTKDELVKTLQIAQLNYNNVLELYGNVSKLAENMYKEAAGKGIEFDCLKGEN